MMRMVCFTSLALAIVMLVAGPILADDLKIAQPKANGKKIGPAQTLFAKENWYQNQKGKEQAFEGVVSKNDRGGAFGFGRFNPFRLQMKKGMREIYIGGRVKLLDPYVGKKVRIIGKPVTLGVEGSIHNEIWPASIALLDGGKVDLGDAVKGKPVRILGQATISNYSGGPRGFDFKAKPTTLPLRSEKAFDKMMGRQASNVLRLFKVEAINFEKHMAIWVQAGQKRTGGFRVTIDRIVLSEADEKMTVYWTLHPPRGGALIQVITNPGAIVLVEKFNGKIAFVQHAPPRLKPGEKVPPQALPLKRLPVRRLGPPLKKKLQ